MKKITVEKLHRAALAKGPIAIGNFKKLVDEWRLIHAQADLIEEYSDKGNDWESLCIGWCMGKGLTVKTAYWFYQQMIPLDLF